MLRTLLNMCIIISFTVDALAQNSNLTNSHEKYGAIPDSSRYESWMVNVPLNFSNRTVFGNGIAIGKGKVKYFSFKDTLINHSIDLKHAKFADEVYFNKIHFSESVEFTNAEFDNEVHFDNAKFSKSATFWQARFDDEAIFFNTEFKNIANFGFAVFDKLAFFWKTRFDSLAYFYETQFNSRVEFYDIVFKGEIRLQNAVFTEGVDFRTANFDSVSRIYLENIRFPEGTFLIYWDQIREKDGFRIAVDHSQNENVKDYYNRMSIVYKKLRDNYLAQGNRASGDAVMYEMGCQREKLLDEFWWKAYGWIFGYGYQPWRFLLFVVLPVIISFAVVWYYKYFGIVATILGEKNHPNVRTLIQESKGKKLTGTIGIKENKYTIRFEIYDHSDVSKDINLIYRLWYVLFFSTSVLLGIRFKKEWFDIGSKRHYGYKTFLRMVSFQWSFGIGLYITFGLSIMGSRFEFIRGILGF